MLSVSNWISGTALNDLLIAVSWAVPLIQVIHILSLALVLTSAAVLSARALGVIFGQVDIEAVVKRFSPVLWGALVLMVASGVLLIIAEPERSLINPVFGLKMALLVAAVGATLLLQKRLNGIVSLPDGQITLSASLQFLAVINLGLWVAIASCGRLIAYYSTH